MRLTKDDFSADDHGPTRTGMWTQEAKLGWDRQSSIWHKIPYRYIEQCLKKWIGKSWTELHQKWSKKFDRRTYLGQEVWKHIDRTVETTAFMWNGKVWGDTAFYRRPSFYVHPQTGLICLEPGRQFNRPKAPITLIKLDEFNTIEKLKGIWYHRQSKMVEETRPIMGLVNGCWAPTADIRREMVRKQVFLNQLSTADLKHRGLRNDVIMRTPSRREIARRKAS